MWPLPLLSSVATGLHDGSAARRNQPYSSRSARPDMSSSASCLSVLALRAPRPMLHCVAAAATLRVSSVAARSTGRAWAADGSVGSRAAARATAARAGTTPRDEALLAGRSSVRRRAGGTDGTGLPEVARRPDDPADPRVC